MTRNYPLSLKIYQIKYLFSHLKKKGYLVNFIYNFCSQNGFKKGEDILLNKILERVYKFQLNDSTVIYSPRRVLDKAMFWADTIEGDLFWRNICLSITNEIVMPNEAQLKYIAKMRNFFV